jgi:hypothetical protein
MGFTIGDTIRLIYPSLSTKASTLRFFFASLVLACVIALPPMVARADYKIIPAITVSETYDTNVFFSTGSDRDDFVTRLSPELRAEFYGRPIEGNITGIFVLETFAKHSEFNNGSAFGNVNLNLNQLIGRLDRRATLSISENIFYTPELPAFVSPTATGTAPASVLAGPSATAAGGVPTSATVPANSAINPFATGIQPQRARAFSTTTSATGGYALTPRVDLEGGYSYGYLRFGNTVGEAAQTSLFTTTFQTATAGPRYRLTPTDGVTAQFQYQKADFSGGAPGFHTEGGTLGYDHSFSPRLSSNIAAGATRISPGDRVALLANASLSWTEQNSSIVFLVNHNVTPSFVVQAGALETTTVALALTQKISERMTGSGQLNYAHSSSTQAGSSISFDSYGAAVGLSYFFTRYISGNLTYNHLKFKTDVTGGNTSFDRDQVLLSVRAELR